jgi:hypothetical protein
MLFLFGQGPPLGPVIVVLPNWPAAGLLPFPAAGSLHPLSDSLPKGQWFEETRFWPEKTTPARE